MILPRCENNVIVCRDLEDLARKASVEFVRLANQSVAKEGRFVAALSGGSTPKGLYSLLATPEFREQVPWSKVHLFWGDERCVPPDHPESNYRMVYEALLSKVPVSAENVYRTHEGRSP